MGLSPQQDMTVQAVDEFVDKLRRLRRRQAAYVRHMNDMNTLLIQFRMHVPEYSEGDSSVA